MRTGPLEELGRIQRRDPVDVIVYVHDDGVVDDLAVLIEHGRVLGAPDRRLCHIAHEQVLDEPIRIRTLHLHEVVGPAIPCGVLAYGACLGARSLVFLE